jgi:hypothetical protein
MFSCKLFVSFRIILFPPRAETTTTNFAILPEQMECTCWLTKIKTEAKDFSAAALGMRRCSHTPTFLHDNSRGNEQRPKRTHFKDRAS